MSVVSLLNVDVKNNPAPFGTPYEFEITFECLEPLQKDLEWKLTYVGSATSAEHDQVLDTLLVGPIPVGVNKFMFEADSPDFSKIPNTEVIGVTVILLSCAYDEREFVRVGYYVNNEYADEALAADPPAKPILEKVRRSILAEKPRVTRFAIKWDSEESAPAEYPPEQPEADTAEDDEAAYGAEELVEEETDAVEETEPTKVEGEDAEMAGAEENAEVHVAKEDDEVSEAGSEDLEAESSGEEDEEELEEEGEGECEGDDEEMDTAEDGEKPTGSVLPAEEPASLPEHQQHQQQDVMVH